MLVALGGARRAQAQSDRTRDALERLEDTLALRFEQHMLQHDALVPAVVVSVAPLYADAAAGYPTAALAALSKVFGAGALRLCEACRVPRIFVDDSGLTQSFGAASIDEIIRLDQSLRGNAPPARTAIWLDETETGVALRIIELATGNIVWVETLDPELKELARSANSFSLTRELHRRVSGEGLTHAFVDMSIYPNQHFSLDWVDQWGESNANLSGFTLSLFDPLVGVGGAYYRIMRGLDNTALGFKILLSVPTALVRQFGGDANVTDNLLTGVLVLRWPLFESYGLLLTASTNGRIGIGISLLNTSLLPMLP